ncbi:MAG: hypothetical protein WC846_04405 [Candidatus Gracilibacteria bacterium]
MAKFGDRPMCGESDSDDLDGMRCRIDSACTTAGLGGSSDVSPKHLLKGSVPGESRFRVPNTGVIPWVFVTVPHMKVCKYCPAFKLSTTNCGPRELFGCVGGEVLADVIRIVLPKTVGQTIDSWLTASRFGARIAPCGLQEAISTGHIATARETAPLVVRYFQALNEGRSRVHPECAALANFNQLLQEVMALERTSTGVEGCSGGCGDDSETDE